VRHGLVAPAIAPRAARTVGSSPAAARRAPGRSAPTERIAGGGPPRSLRKRAKASTTGAPAGPAAHAIRTTGASLSSPAAPAER